MKNIVESGVKDHHIHSPKIILLKVVVRKIIFEEKKCF
jgi:hypothetical protein